MAPTPHQPRITAHNRPVVGYMGHHEFRWPFAPALSTLQWDYHALLNASNLRDFRRRVETALEESSVQAAREYLRECKRLFAVAQREVAKRGARYRKALRASVLRHSRRRAGEPVDPVGVNVAMLDTRGFDTRYFQPLFWCVVPRCPEVFDSVVTSREHALIAHEQWVTSALQVGMDSVPEIQAQRAFIERQEEILRIARSAQREAALRHNTRLRDAFLSGAPLPRLPDDAGRPASPGARRAHTRNPLGDSDSASSRASSVASRRRRSPRTLSVVASSDDERNEEAPPPSLTPPTSTPRQDPPH